MYLENYSKNGVDKDRKIIVLKIEKNFRLLIDKKSGTKILVISKFIA